MGNLDENGKPHNDTKCKKCGKRVPDIIEHAKHCKGGFTTRYDHTETLVTKMVLSTINRYKYPNTCNECQKEIKLADYVRMTKDKKTKKTTITHEWCLKNA
jgi:hypothetical protein